MPVGKNAVPAGESVGAMESVASEGLTSEVAKETDAGNAALESEEAEVAVAEEDLLSLEALLLARTYLYTLFHKLFGGNPTATLMERLLSDATFDATDEYVDADESMRGLRAFLENLRNCDDYDALADEAIGEFTRLFIGPGRPEALPIESPYLTNEATLFQANTLAVRGEYAESGYQPVRCTHVPDDHLSLMCCFMDRLGAQSLEALRAGKLEDLAAGMRTQQSFALRHMANWLPDCAKKARSSKTALLYPQMLEALSVFVDVDITFLGEAAFWAESSAASSGESAQVAESAAAMRPESFAVLEDALFTLRELRLFGLEDNELVEL